MGPASAFSFRQVLSKAKLALGADFTSRLIARLAGFQTYRQAKHTGRNPSVTRSMLLVALHDLDESRALHEILEKSGLKWTLFRQETGLEGDSSDESVEDVQVTQEFAQSMVQLGASAAGTELSADTLGLHLLQLAIDDTTGSLRERLESCGANLEQLKMLVGDRLSVKTPAKGGAEPRPTLWLLQYKNLDEWTPQVSGKGDRTPWFSRKRIKGIKAGDPVLYWRTVDTKSADRGGLMGVGRFLPEAAAEGDTAKKTTYSYPSEVLHWSPEKLVERDVLIAETDLKMNWSLGSIQAVPANMAAKINTYLLNTIGITVFPSDMRGHAELVGDTPSLEEDHLRTSSTAFILAARLNRVWLQNTKPDDDAKCDKELGSQTSTSPQGLLTKIRHRLKNSMSCLLVSGYGQGNKSTYVVHVDAPWGGGKTSFANYLQAILNPSILKGRLPDWFTQLDRYDPNTWPAEFPSSWYTVCFNAWIHQHMDPPWWTLYQALRQQCFEAVRKDVERGLRRAKSGTATSGGASRLAQSGRNLLRKTGITWILCRLRALPGWVLLWLSELSWRLVTPRLSLQALTLTGTVLLYLILSPEYVDPKILQKFITGEGTSNVQLLWTTALMVLFGGATAVWTLVSAFTQTLLPGTPTAAKNYSLGSSDPFDRFRRHFGRIVCLMRRPVMVVIDDIDRCDPKLVVELMHGIQTLFRSPRVVFVVLGDRRWIEQSYSVVHKNMSSIQTEAEHSFGGRFVEKVFQLSLVLPGVAKDQKRDYLYGVLGLSQSRELEIQATQQPDKTMPPTTAKMKKEQARLTAAKTKQERAFTQAMESAVNPITEQKVKFELKPVTCVLPNNPRQIKRIINSISFYQEIAMMRYGWGINTAGWRKLALWVIVMTEWPSSWKILASRPHRINDLRTIRQAENNQSVPDQENIENSLFTREEILSIAKNNRLWEILDFSLREEWKDAKIDQDAIEDLNVIMPPPATYLSSGHKHNGGERG